ncbi:DUF7344 domain-containing protein [Halobellus litoreus]|uniref:DUF7344 domain-containing protein n=1 Tax=Halobellus litoreus TaxID=755310 RepID=A0ABD6DVU6_9EURY|nr:hypothetical protein [Halobellus litoreus]
MKGGAQITKTRQDAGKPGASNDRELSTETVFETLSSRRRRYTLHYLTQVDGPVTIRDLSEQIAAWENRIERQAVTPKQRKRVYTALHQTHLPTMDRLGVVEYDKDRGTITMTDHVRAFDIYLDVVPRDDIPWSQFYLVLGSVLSALVVVGALGFPPFSYVGGFGYALFVAAAFTVAGCVHTIRDRRSLIGTTATPPDVEPPREITEEA